jgi:hypothetical protein
MNPLKLAFLLCLLALPCAAQSITAPIPPVTGSFYVSVDDSCAIFVNGKRFHNTGQVGDRVVVRLTNNGGPRHVMVAFASSDGQRVTSFKKEDFKSVPELGVSDFSVAEFAGWPPLKGTAKFQKHKPKLPVKSYSEAVWGDLDKCIIASVVTQKMISQGPK